MRIVKFIPILLLFLVSCKSTKKVTDSSEEIKKMSSRRIVKKHTATNFDRKTVDAKLRVNYKSGKDKLGLSARLKIVKDEVIWIKGTKFITVLRAKITPTTISYFSPYNKTYFEGDFSMINEILGVEITFNQLQNILLGQVAFETKKQKYSSEIENKSYSLTPKEQQLLFDFFFWVNPQHFKLDKQAVKNDVKSQLLEVSYKEYSKNSNTVFPKLMTIVAKDKAKTTSIQLNYKSVIFDKELNTSYKIPQGYKRVTF